MKKNSRVVFFVDDKAERSNGCLFCLLAPSLCFAKKSIGIFLRRFPTTTWVQMNWVEQRCVFYFNLPQPRKGMTTTSGSFFRGDDEGGNQDVKQRTLYVSKMEGINSHMLIEVVALETKCTSLQITDLMFYKLRHGV